MLVRILLALLLIPLSGESAEKSVLIAIDVSASTILADVNREIPKFVDEFIQSLPENVNFEIVTFASEIRQVSSPQKATLDNKASVRGLLYILQPGNQDDAVIPLISYIEKAEPTLAIIFTDGHYSDLQASDALFDLLRRVRERGTVIIPVSIGSDSNEDLLEKISLVTQGVLLSFSDKEKLRRELTGFVLKLLFPEFNIEKSKSLTLNAENLPGILIFPPPCEKIKLIDPEWRVLSMKEMEKITTQIESFCALILDRAGSWRYYSEQETIELDNLQLKASIPTSLLEGQVVKVEALWENNGIRIALNKILDSSKVELTVNQEKVLGDPVIREELKLDAETRSFKTTFISPREGDYEVKLSGKLPFLTRHLQFRLTIRGRIVELMDKETALRSVKKLADQPGFYLKTKPGVKLSKLHVDGGSEVVEITPSVYFVPLDNPRSNLKISGAALSGRENIEFVYLLDINEDNIIVPPPKKEALDLLALAVGVSTSLLGGVLLFLMDNKNKETVVAKVDDQVIYSIENLKSRIQRASARNEDELFEAALVMKSSPQPVQRDEEI